MAKLFASEVAMEIALNAVRVHGGYGYSTEFDVERYFRDAPLMIVGGAPTRSSRNVIAAQLVKRGRPGLEPAQRRTADITPRFGHIRQPPTYAGVLTDVPGTCCHPFGYRPRGRVSQWATGEDGVRGAAPIG